MKCRHLAAVAAMSLPGIVLADSPWSGDASAGYIRTTGNTDSTSLNAKGDLDWKSGPWDNQAKALAGYASSKGESTAEAYQFGNKLNRDFSAFDYAFASLDYANDRFAGITSRYSEAVGYGRHFIKTDTQILDGDVGAGDSQQRDAGATDYGTQVIGVLNVSYLLKLTPTSQFKQTLHVEAGHTDVFINPVSELKLTVIGNVFASLAYDWRHNTSVPAGNVHTDTTTTVNFGYTFGKKPA
jgi:putative salt-induced outer membrane protein